MAGIQGLRGTGQFDNDFRPKNYRELFTLLEPNGNAPLNGLLAMTGSEATDDPSFKNFRDELPDRKLSVNGAVASTSTAAITVDAGNDNLFAVAGSIIVNASTGEVMRATADATATGLTVERNIGGTSHQIADGDELFIAGTAYEEGANSPTGVSFDATVAENFTQIFRTAFTVTETLRATNLRTGDKEDEMATKALKMHMMDIERAMFFGKKHETNGSTAQPRRFTGGLINTLSNVIDRSGSDAGVMTEDQFDRALIEDIFAFGSKQKIMFCGAKVAGHLQKFGKDRWSPHIIEDTYGVSLTGYETFAGTLAVHLHPQFRMVPGMENAAVIVDFPYLKYRYMEGRDTALLRDRQSPDADAVKHEYLTECGLELLQDKVHTYIKNWDAVAA